MSSHERPLFEETEKEPKLEFPNGREAIPKEIDTVFWDVDGTITAKEVVDQYILKIILETANNGVKHNFVTGRDRFWLIENLKIPLVKAAEEENLDANKVLSSMGFYPELGLISLDPISDQPEVYPEVLNHRLTSGSFRERIASFFLQEKDLQKVENSNVPPRNYVIKDANGVQFLFPMISSELNTTIKLPDFIWSETKEVIGTAELVRDVERRVTPARQAKIILAAEIVNKFLSYWEADRDITLSPVSTAINIAPIVDGIPLDKDWAAGRIIQHKQHELAKSNVNITLEEISQKSIGIGDGYADFLFSRPRIGRDRYLDVALVYVGPSDQIHKDEDKTKNLAIKSENYQGPKATLDALKILKDHFVQKAE